MRQRFDINTGATGIFVDTGEAVSGLIMGIRFDGATLDTRTRVKLEAISDGRVIADFADAGGVWTRVPRVGTYDTGGDAISDAYHYLDHDQLRLTVDTVAGDTGGVDTGNKTATCYVYMGW
jgi:hypothetical protein